MTILVIGWVWFHRVSVWVGWFHLVLIGWRCGYRVGFIRHSLGSFFPTIDSCPTWSNHRHRHQRRSHVTSWLTSSLIALGLICMELSPKTMSDRKWQQRRRWWRHLRLSMKPIGLYTVPIVKIGDKHRILIVIEFFVGQHRMSQHQRLAMHFEYLSSSSSRHWSDWIRLDINWQLRKEKESKIRCLVKESRSVVSDHHETFRFRTRLELEVRLRTVRLVLRKVFNRI